MTVDTSGRSEVVTNHSAKCSSSTKEPIVPEYTPRSEEEKSDYTPLPEEKEPEYTPAEGEDNFDDYMYDDGHDDTYGEDFIVNCGIVSVLPAEYDVVSEVSETKEDFVSGEEDKDKLLCYYVKNSGVVEEQQTMFEKPTPGMMYHLKPMFIKAKVDGVAVNKFFVDGGAVVNLMPLTLLKKMGKGEEDLRPHNMVLSNYEGKTNSILGVIQVELVVGTTTRMTMFMVIKSKANFILLLGREWIHRIGVVPSTLHQRLIIWRKDGIVENIEADQSYYKTEIPKGEKRSFDQHLANIAPCDDESSSYTSVNTGRMINLDPDHGFV